MVLFFHRVNVESKEFSLNGNLFDHFRGFKLNDPQVGGFEFRVMAASHHSGEVEGFSDITIAFL